MRLTLLLADAKVEKRPIPHPPVASPYAGSSVPKIVYVSTGTPFMSAVKRVQKLLHQAEKRATANVNLEDTRKTEQQKLAELAKAAEKREEAFVKATGRAIEKALNLAKWFQEKEAEYTVRVTTGSVLVVDDVVEDEEKKKLHLHKRNPDHVGEQDDGPDGSIMTWEGDETAPVEKGTNVTSKKRKRPRPAASEETELPETRTRWIKTVEVAIGFK